MQKKIAVCPGSFDPITMGHLDIIKRAGALFDSVIVLVMNNTSKKPVFTKEERMEMIKQSVKDLPNVTVDSYDGLLANYVKQKGAVAIVKGLRAVSDFEYEFQMALMNKKLNPQAETMFFTTSTENLYLSSSIVKSIASMNGDITGLVPACIQDNILERFKEKGV